MRAWDLRRRAGAVSDGRGRAQHQRNTRIEARKRSMRPNARSCSRPDTKRERVPTARPKPLRPHPPLARRVPAACKRPTHRSAAVRQPPPLHPLAAPASPPCPPPAAPRWQCRRPFHPPSAAHARDGARALLLSPLSPPLQRTRPASPRSSPGSLPPPFIRSSQAGRDRAPRSASTPCGAGGRVRSHTARCLRRPLSAPRGKEKSDRQNSTLPDKSRENMGNVRSAGIVWKATMEVPSATASRDACSAEEEQRGDDEEGDVAHFNTGARRAGCGLSGRCKFTCGHLRSLARSHARASEPHRRAAGAGHCQQTRRGSLTLVAAHPL